MRARYVKKCARRREGKFIDYDKTLNMSCCKNNLCCKKIYAYSAASDDHVENN